MKSKSITLTSSCEIIALKCLVSEKNEINDFFEENECTKRLLQMCFAVQFSSDKQA